MQIVGWGGDLWLDEPQGQNIGGSGPQSWQMPSSYVPILPNINSCFVVVIIVISIIR